MRFILTFLCLTCWLSFPVAGALAADPLVVYSARKEELIKPLFDRFTKESGIAVQFLSDEAPKLIARIESEAEASPADLLLTADAVNLELAASKGLLAPVESAALDAHVPAFYRDDEKRWTGLSKRVRAIFYHKDTVKPEELSTYEDLADPKWKGEILLRSSAHPYNQSLLANIIAVDGKEKAQAWANGLTKNLARTPQGGDADQLKAVAAGEAKLAVANSYYYGRMSKSPLPEDKLVVQNVGIFFPNQHAGAGMLSGAHVNISGGGVVTTSKRPEEAKKLLEFLASPEAQRIYAEANMEYPISTDAAPDAILKAWGDYKVDRTPIAVWAAHAAEATRIADLAGWK